jgi:flagellar hook-associated protein 3 FlgL
MMVQNLMNNQAKVFNDQRQLNTGKIADQFQGMASNVATVIGARSFKAQTDSFQSVIKTMNGRISANDVQIEGVLSMARKFRDDLLAIIAQEEAIGFPELLSENYSFVASSLNTKIGGSYLFAGSKTEIPPITSTEINDLRLAASPTDMFQNDNRPAKAQIASGIEMEFGVVASDVATDLFTVYRDIAVFDFATPIDGKLTPAQTAFLVAELANLDAAIDSAQSIQMRNGLKANRLDTIAEQHIETSNFLETFVSDLEDVNIAEAITRLNTDQMALEASFRTMATLSSISLLDFI